MNRKLIFSVLVVFLLLVSAAVVAADETDPYADSVVEFVQGLRLDGTPVNANRSDPLQALGAPDSVFGIPGTFTSLGFGGQITLGFDNYICGPGPLTVTAYEVTWGTYPLEKAEVYLSQDGVNWFFGGTVDNQGDVTAEYSGLDWARYVKVVDITDGSLHNPTGNTDGYDLDAVEAYAWSTGPCPIEVTIDIKPGSYPSCFNNNGHGVIPVAIFGSADFDVYQIDPATVSLEGMPIATRGSSNRPQASFEDVDGDGYDDLVVKIRDVDGTFTPDDFTAGLDGFLFDGTPIEGTGDICITQ